MATEATYKIYNGTEWEEMTFTPSSHTHTAADLPDFIKSVNRANNGITITNKNNISTTLTLIPFIPVNSGSATETTCIDLSAYLSAYAEIMIIVRIVTYDDTKVGLSSTSGSNVSTNFGCNVDVDAGTTTYLKITINKTTDNYFACEIIGSASASSTRNMTAFCWGALSSCRYLRFSGDAYMSLNIFRR